MGSWAARTPRPRFTTSAPRRRLAFAAAAGAFALVLSACGGSSDSDGNEVASLDDQTVELANASDDTAQAQSADGEAAADGGTSAPETDPELAFAAWEDCMSEQGIDIFTGDGGGSGAIAIEGNDLDEIDPQEGGTAVDLSDIGLEDFEAAEAECEHHLEGIDTGFDLNPEQQAMFDDAMLEFQKCMEEQGIDLPDIDDQGGFTIAVEGDADPQDSGSGFSDFGFEEFEAAAEECEHVFAELEAQIDDGATDQ